jgi:hypothetical protein
MEYVCLLCGQATAPRLPETMALLKDHLRHACIVFSGSFSLRDMLWAKQDLAMALQD